MGLFFVSLIKKNEFSTQFDKCGLDANLNFVSAGELKNYIYEIEMYLDWISPYIDEPEGTVIGEYMYEEQESPYFVHYIQGKAVFQRVNYANEWYDPHAGI